MSISENQVSTASTGLAASIPRRTFVTAACAAGCLVAAGCSSAESSSDSAPTSSAPVEVPVASVPVGGGTILTSKRLVVTQPFVGTFKAFSAVCTHQGCLVSEISDGAITCACHGSQFSIKDGSVITPPAKDPLDGLQVTRTGDTLTVT